MAKACGTGDHRRMQEGAQSRAVTSRGIGEATSVLPLRVGWAPALGRVQTTLGRARVSQEYAHSLTRGCRYQQTLSTWESLESGFTSY